MTIHKGSPDNDASIEPNAVKIQLPTGKFSDFIVYVDESGDHGMQTMDPKYPIFVLAFCVFQKRHYFEKVVPILQEFKFTHFVS